MKGGFWWAIALALVIVAGVTAFIFIPTSVSTDGVTPTGTAQIVSGGAIALNYPTGWTLATSSDQILVRAVIPPCDAGFDSCLYYTGAAYNGTNFESAGLRVTERKDLSTPDVCLNTAPEGYADLTPKVFTRETYATSIFAPLSAGAAGHTASGALLRLATDSSCYEFETRIAQTSFSNYPPGTIKEFTDAEQAQLLSDLSAMLNTVTITATAQKVLFTDSQAEAPPQTGVGAGTPAESGALAGTITIGPICPVERVDNPCKPTAAMYAAHKVYVYRANKKTLVSTLTPDAEGAFAIALPAGDYWVDVKHDQVGSVSGAPVAIHLNGGQTSTVAISIDTGIR